MRLMTRKHLSSVAHSKGKISLSRSAQANTREEEEEEEFIGGVYWPNLSRYQKELAGQASAETSLVHRGRGAANQCSGCAERHIAQLASGDNQFDIVIVRFLGNRERASPKPRAGLVWIRAFLIPAVSHRSCPCAPSMRLHPCRPHHQTATVRNFPPPAVHSALTFCANTQQ